MIHKLAIIDDFLDSPDSIRKTIIETPMRDHKASDGVTYPGIVELSGDLKKYLANCFASMYQGVFQEQLMFARHSYSSMDPPHWAHSDRNMCRYVGLIYLSPIDYPHDGTHLVMHRETSLEYHPQTESDRFKIMRDSNVRSKWDIVMTVPSRYNRLLVLDAACLHASALSFGTNRINSRLVLSVFFDLL